MKWIEEVTDVRKHPSDLEHWLQDGSVLSKLMSNIVFNSTPKEDEDEKEGCRPEVERVKSVIFEMHRQITCHLFTILFTCIFLGTASRMSSRRTTFWR